MQAYRYAPLTPGPGDKALEEVLRHIAVPADVLNEAKDRRNLVCKLAMRHAAARDTWYSGSIAHGTHNSPLGDADCGVMVDRRSQEFRAYGPDADGTGLGPEGFIQAFAQTVIPLLRAHYPTAEVDLSGNRAIKFLFNERIDFGEFGAVDPYVDLIVGLDRRDAPGIWIPNRRRRGWDAAHPQKHTELMTRRDPQELVVHRAHLIRLGKRAIKRDGVDSHAQAMCSWNFSALALEHVELREPLAAGLTALFADASESIAAGLTKDPARVADPIALPDGVTQADSARRLARMVTIVSGAAQASSLIEARRILSAMFGVEIDEIRERERDAVRRSPLNPALRSGDAAAVGAALGTPGPVKTTRSHGGRRCP
ncbi:MAG TPA: hypothetical protein VGM91_20230 [Conexibacter sp.]|jgi:hypothetical protein